MYFISTQNFQSLQRFIEKYYSKCTLIQQYQHDINGIYLTLTNNYQINFDYGTSQLRILDTDPKLWDSQTGVTIWNFGLQENMIITGTGAVLKGKDVLTNEEYIFWLDSGLYKLQTPVDKTAYNVTAIYLDENNNINPQFSKVPIFTKIFLLDQTIEIYNLAMCNKTLYDFLQNFTVQAIRQAQGADSLYIFKPSYGSVWLGDNFGRNRYLVLTDKDGILN